ncbi:hypothetical protein CEN44_20975 [Fischerella muscicola CCMEE 5323]|uniref:Uncharacterized protein n=1 Tax=Fischerella muscicola CCMEE 5323 TaxID=2019572 RepID=A0A2N6JYK6_FISMU|nr:hypothetical protein CEN44_20975 [Fischerella muscicola CCMEE 5323]
MLLAGLAGDHPILDFGFWILRKVCRRFAASRRVLGLPAIKAFQDGLPPQINLGACTIKSSSDFRFWIASTD